MLFEQQMQLMRIVDASGVSNSESRVKLPMVKLPSTGERRNGNASQKYPIDDSYQQRFQAKISIFGYFIERQCSQGCRVHRIDREL